MYKGTKLNNVGFRYLYQGTDLCVCIYHEEEEEDTCVSSCYTRALTWCIVGMYTRALTWDFFFTTGKDDENDADEDVEEDEVTGSRHTFSKKKFKKKKSDFRDFRE